MRPPDTDDVRAIRYFETLSDESASRLAREWSVRAYGPRELVIRAGEPARGFYFMRHGKARILRTGADGREQTFRLAATGDTFGEVPVLDGAPNPATVETLEPSEIVFIPTESFLRAIQAHPEVAMPVIVHIARRLRSFTELVEQISLQTVHGRLARYLYQLASEEGVARDGSIVVPREITQQDLASLVGSVREVVSRTLKTMEEDGVVTIRRKEIEIHDLEALRSYL
ncbi:MAG: Crp/Fnr family transcriptional regulator [Tepidiformaceae bacterium]